MTHFLHVKDLSPLHVSPFAARSNPGLQWHVKLPSVFAHSCSQFALVTPHSSTSKMRNSTFLFLGSGEYMGHNVQHTDFNYIWVTWENKDLLHVFTV